MTTIRMIPVTRKVVFGIGLCVASIASIAFGTTAWADASCNNLLASARSSAASCVTAGCTLNVTHTTNFQQDTSIWGGFDETVLTLNNSGHLVGTGNRLHSDRRSGSQPFDIHQPETLTYDFDPSGELTFDGIYGPADPVCYFDKFMVIPGSGSVEVFSFHVVPSGSKDPVCGPNPC